LSGLSVFAPVFLNCVEQSIFLFMEHCNISYKQKAGLMLQQVYIRHSVKI